MIPDTFTQRGVGGGRSAIGFYVNLRHEYFSQYDLRLSTHRLRGCANEVNDQNAGFVRL